jgi:hypothetical protein
MSDIEVVADRIHITSVMFAAPAIERGWTLWIVELHAVFCDVRVPLCLDKYNLALRTLLA